MFFYLVIISILIWVSVTDIRYRIISNKVVLVLLLVLLPFVWIQYEKIFFLPAMITLVIGFILFTLNIVGGGDVKLISILMLAVPNEQIISFLFLTSLFGLLLIIFGWIFFRSSIKQQGLPYGVAISLGFLSNTWLFS